MFSKLLKVRQNSLDNLSLCFAYFHQMFVFQQRVSSPSISKGRLGQIGLIGTDWVDCAQKGLIVNEMFTYEAYLPPNWKQRRTFSLKRLSGNEQCWLWSVLFQKLFFYSNILCMSESDVLSSLLLRFFFLQSLLKPLSQIPAWIFLWEKIFSCFYIFILSACILPWQSTNTDKMEGA